METVLTTESLTKKYKNTVALKDLSFEVQRGQVFGLLGPNGSGKTTTLGILLGIIQPNDGEYNWFGNGNSDENRKRIGALLETPNFYPYLNAVDNLRIVAEIKGFQNPEPHIEEALKKVNLWSRKDAEFKAFSLGMKQRLALASVMLNDPDVMVLDEPTNGLDPQGIAEIRSLIQEIAKGGKTIIIASHLLDEIEKLCSHVAILKNGSLLKTGTLEEILLQDKMLYLEAPDMNKLKNILDSSPNYDIVKNNGKGIMIKVDDSTPASEVNKFCAEKGVYLSSLSEYKNNLESIFLDLVN